MRAAAALLFASACATFMPALRDPREVAQERERTACARNATALPALFDPSSVVRVEPLTSSLRSGRSGYESRLNGARIVLAPIPNTTAEWVESVLLCHNARRTLERPGEPDILDDPYWIENRVLDLSARSEEGGLTVLVRADDFETASEILRRARAFQGRPGG
jgi:hypothetical protein